MGNRTLVQMASSVSETLLTPPVVNALNVLMNTTGAPPPKVPEPKESLLGFTHYTCLPSRSKPATYECVKNYKGSVVEDSLYTTLTTKISIQTDSKAWKFFTPEELHALPTKSNLERKSYLVCYEGADTRMECQKGTFRSPLQEGKPYKLKIPTLLPSHQTFLNFCAVKFQIVPAFTEWSARSGT